MSADVQRSLLRALAEKLDMEVRFADDEAAFTRPSAHVVAGAVTSTAVGARHAERAQAFTIYCYPTSGVGAGSSELEAGRVLAQLVKLLTPRRLQLWDFGPLHAPGTPQAAGWMRVLPTPMLERFSDPDGRWVVTAELRLATTEPFRDDPDGLTVETVTTKPGG